MAAITFQAIPREDISRVVAGVALRAKPINADSLDGLEGLLGEDSVGLVTEVSSNGASQLILVRDDQLQRFYAWVSTYLPGISPLSQLIRVITVSEFKDVLSRKVGSENRFRQAWVGVVLGECMARTKDMRSFSGMSLAAAQSAVSLPIAKMYALGVSIVEYKRALSRLNFLPYRSSNSLGALNSDQLMPVWSALSGCDFYREFASGTGASSKAQDLLSSACIELSMDGRVSDDLLLAMAKIFEPARELMYFDSAPAENRVSLFDQIVEKRTLNADVATGLGQIQAFIIGYAASRIAVGGLRHVVLLDGLGLLEGIAKVWFCLCCFITGRASMADSMVNLARLIDRELRHDFSAFHVPRHDIGWEEFSSMTVSENQAKQLTLLPKASPRSASIEIVPGAAIVVSVGSKEQVAVDTSITKPILDEGFVTKQMADLDKALAEIWQIREAFIGRNITKNAKSDSIASFDSEKKAVKKKKKAPNPSDLF
ncbi:hypothetical protein [Xanthomonas campestris]|uniref:hypothetical protein n=1 Tax=Xanthomonas campestris TaxID=339 RepID=UPI002367BCDA|nr:hypothetical protein [Xanthomonas campestris]WDI93183.1 hypothetical protein JH280_18350 [Xanthomonas campestris]